MKYPFPRVERPPVFAVIDPREPGARWIVDALGTDAVELESPRAHPGAGGARYLRVRVDRLGTDQLARVARAIAGFHRISLAMAMVEALHLSGLSISERAAYVCGDPEQGRRYFAMLREGGGS